jgi:excisionase family DNA binding protein
MQTNMTPLVVKMRGACTLLGSSRWRISKLIARGELQSFKDGRSRKIVVASIEDYVKRQVAGNHKENG